MLKNKIRIIIHQILKEIGKTTIIKELYTISPVGNTVTEIIESYLSVIGATRTRNRVRELAISHIYNYYPYLSQVG